MIQTLLIERDGATLQIFLGENITARGEFGELRLASIPSDAYGEGARYAIATDGEALLGTEPLSRPEAEAKIIQTYRERGYTVRAGNLLNASVAA